MAQAASNVKAGGPLVYFAPWVLNQQSLTPAYVEVGHTNAVGWNPTMENFDVESEQANGIIVTFPVKDSHTLKIPALESRADILVLALGQPAAASGTGLDKTVQFTDRTEQYFTIKIQVPGVGTTKVRTLTFWKCQIVALAEVSFSKKAVQMYSMDFRVMRDDTEAGGVGFYGRQVDA